MHILAVIILVALLLIFYFDAARRARGPDLGSSQSSDNHARSSLEFSRGLAFISKGKMFYRERDGDVKEIHSHYIQDSIDRLERSQKLHDWKEGTSFSTSYTGREKTLGGDQLDIVFSSAIHYANDKLLYFLKDENFGGLFEYDLNTGDEKRLLHQQKLDYQDIRSDRESNRLLCAQYYANGIANITTFEPDGSESKELTAGDTVDRAPSFIPGENRILFECAGLARGEDGFVIALGPSTIQLLDLGDADLSTILEHPNFDFLSPRVNSHGDLYFIRRPFEAVKYHGRHLFTDIVLFPFRLIRAVFHYLNFFSLMYTRKPLTSASGPKVEADLKEIMLKGKRINAENALRKERAVSGVPSLVPRSWELIRKDRDGNESILATNVASYDIDDDDQLVYSNGFGIFLLGANNHPQLLLRDTLINEIII